MRRGPGLRGATVGEEVQVVAAAVRGRPATRIGADEHHGTGGVPGRATRDGDDADRAPVDPSTDSTTVSAPSIAEMPSASIAHIAWTSVRSDRTRCGVGVAENGYATTISPSAPSRIASDSCNARSTAGDATPAATGGRPVAANARRIARCAARSASSGDTARVRHALGTSAGASTARSRSTEGPSIRHDSPAAPDRRTGPRC